jgi:DNA/RNA endonuclease YhcR with UshA esterase domain
MVAYMKKTAFIIFGLALLALFLLGCVAGQSIKDVKAEANVGKTVIVSGTVTGVVSIGGLSYYVLDDNTATINVSAARLPANGDKVTANGTLIKDTLFGYYIKVVG